jgi:Ribbon-helix-helix domain
VNTPKYDRLDRSRAVAAVGQAVKSGKLPPVRTRKCDDCGRQAEQYHHEDYGKPLDVTPLCKDCHVMRHRDHPPFSGGCRSTKLATERMTMTSVHLTEAQRTALTRMSRLTGAPIAALIRKAVDKLLHTRSAS